jgi:FkbM family methyltransferase
MNTKIRKSVTIHTKQGVFTVYCADSVIGKLLYCSGEFEMGLSFSVMGSFVHQKKPKGRGTILDIGANIGIISVGMIHNGLVEKAIAIEPEPDNFSLLKRNVRQNKLEDSFICLPYAVSDSSGVIQFELSNMNYGDHRVRVSSPSAVSSELYEESSRRVIEVQSESLDNLLEGLPKSFTDEIVVVWIDVQGYEGYVFKGGKGWLSRGIPTVAEFWPYAIRRAGMSEREFCQIANEIWSSCWVVRGGEFVRYPISALSDMFNELGYGRNLCNIVFTK